MSSERILLISIRPAFAERILNGSKTVELRRQLPRIGPGDLVALYVSSPAREFVGTSTVIAVEVGKPNDLWKVVAAHAGVTRREYDQYFEGANRAVGIFLGPINARRTPIGLSKLRDMINDFNPPQSFRYLRERERTALRI